MTRRARKQAIAAESGRRHLYFAPFASVPEGSCAVKSMPSLHHHGTSRNLSEQTIENGDSFGTAGTCASLIMTSRNKSQRSKKFERTNYWRRKFHRYYRHLRPRGHRLCEDIGSREPWRQLTPQTTVRASAFEPSARVLPRIAAIHTSAWQQTLGRGPP